MVSPLSKKIKPQLALEVAKPDYQPPYSIHGPNHKY